MSDHINSKVSIGSTGGPALRCRDCERMIEDDVLGWSPDRLEGAAQDHRCDEVEQLRYTLEKTEYERNWRKGKDGQ